jgi:hypothetical protein
VSDAIVDLALHIAATPAVGLDLDRHLSGTCTALVRAMRLTAVAVVVVDPAGVHGSDSSAVLIGEAQRGAPVGPVASALRSGRPMVTPDLSRVGPPALAAAAAASGLVCSGVLPLLALGRPVGAVQLLGARGWHVEPDHLDRLAPLAAVLAAQLADVAALARLTAGPPSRPTPVPRTPPADGAARPPGP